MNVFGVFAKFWEAGKVKTRLAKSVGDELAAEIYFQLLKSTRNLGQQIELDQAESRFEKMLGYAPSNRTNEFSNFAPSWNLIPQVESDLGTRMKCFFNSCFESVQNEGDCRVVLIGSDTPALPVRNVHHAFELLHHHDVVLGPSFDGGYYLIGCRNETPDIFSNIDWSTPAVLEQTIARLNQIGCRYAMLEKYNDVDELDDLRKLQSELLQQRDQLPTHQVELFDFLSQLNIADEA